MYRPGFDPEAVKQTLQWVGFFRKQAARKGGTWLAAYVRVLKLSKEKLS